MIPKTGQSNETVEKSYEVAGREEGNQDVLRPFLEWEKQCIAARRCQNHAGVLWWWMTIRPVRALLTDFLEQQDLEVRTAQDGRTALAVFHAICFALILVDFQMPDMTGLEMATEVRQTDSHIPITLVTGVAHALDTAAVVQAGISRIFPKPVSLEELSAWIHSLLL